MSYKSYGNLYLVVRPTVVLTTVIDEVIFNLDPEFKKHNIKGYITSGLRGPKDQLTIIRNEIVKRGMMEEYPDSYMDIDKKEDFYLSTGPNKGLKKEVYGWQLGWSALLNKGFIVNPPLPAEVLMDYVRPGSSINKKGTIIGSSPHATGKAFDIGGGPNGVEDELWVIKEALEAKVKGLKGYLLERNNNCVHCDCY